MAENGQRWEVALRRFVGTAIAFTILVAFYFLASLAMNERGAEEFSSLTDASIESDIWYYERKMRAGEGAICQMSIEEFRRYHALKDERQIRSSN